MSREVQLHRIVRILLTGLIFALFGAMFVPFFTPLLMAALFGFALEGVVSKYAPRRSKRRLPTALILVTFFILVTLPLVVIGVKVVGLSKSLAQTQLQNTEIYKSLESLVGSVSLVISRVMESFGESAPQGGVMDYVGQAGTWVLTYTAGIASRAPELILDLFIFSAALYLFLTEADYIRRTVSSFKVLTERELNEIIRVIKRSSYLTLVVSACTGAVQALTVAFGGLIFGFKEFILIFVVTFFTSFIPVIGAGPVAILMALIAFIQGSVGSGIGLLVVALIAGSVDNIIKPLVVAGQGEENVNPIISLLAIVGAVIIYGIPGLLLGPILTELTLKIVPILFTEDEEGPASPPSA